MTNKEIMTLVRELIPYAIFLGLLFIEIINAIRGRQFYTILLVREFRKMIIGVLQEIRGKDWMAKLNALACMVLFACILAFLFLIIRTIFLDYTQFVIPLVAVTVFGFLFYWTFKTSTNFLSGFD